MAGVAFRVTGIPALARALDNVADEAENSAALGPIAQAIARDIAANAPRRSGRLAGSARGEVTGRRAVASIGRGAIAYAGVQNYGWPARGISGRHFLERAEEAARPLAVRQLEDSINREIRKQGLK